MEFPGMGLEDEEKGGAADEEEKEEEKEEEDAEVEERGGGAEEFPSIPSDDDSAEGEAEGDGAMVENQREGDRRSVDSSLPQERNSKRKVDSAENRLCDLDLDSSRLNAYARASLAFLQASNPRFQQLMPKGKRTRRNAIHVSEAEIMDGVTSSVANDLHVSDTGSSSCNEGVSGGASAESSAIQEAAESNCNLHAATSSAALSLSSKAAAAQSQLPGAARPNLLLAILYFDLNETILVSDKAGGGDIAKCINKALSRAAHVQRSAIEPGTSTVRWHNGLSFEEAAIAQKHLDADSCAVDVNTEEEKSDDTSDLLDGDGGPSAPQFVVPLLDHSQLDPSSHISCWDAREADDNFPISLSRFTEPGVAGHIYRSEFERLRDKLRWHFECPRDVARIFTDPSGLYHFVLPSFFHSMCRLAADARSACQPGETTTGSRIAFNFRPVFRTFGTDLPKVVAVLNAFAQGQHPGFFPSDAPDPLPNSTYRRCALTAAELRRFFFTGGASATAWYCHRGGTAPRAGTSARSGPPDPAQFSPTLRCYSAPWDQARHPPNIELAQRELTTKAAIFKFLCESASPIPKSEHTEVCQPCDSDRPMFTPLAIRDDYFAWNAHDYDRQAGKPAWFDSDAESHPQKYGALVMSVFFDDHIREDKDDPEFSACAYRQDCSGTSHADPASGRALCHLVRANMVQAVEDNSYFYHEVKRCVTEACAFLNLVPEPSLRPQ